MVLQSLEAHRLRLYGPCRDLAAATELKAGTLAAIAAWYPKSHHYSYANQTDGDTFKKGMKQWVYFCQHLCKEEPAFACADGSTIYSLISPDSMDRKSEKRARFWEWLGHTAAEGSNEALNSSKRKQLTKGHTKWCDTFQQKMAEFQFLGCGDQHSRKGILEEADKKTMSELRNSLNATLPETGNNYGKTIGKTVSRDEIRACCLLTAVTWLSSGGSKAHWCYFKLLCIKAFSLYAFSNCRRSVLTRNVMMVDLWAHPAISQQLESVEGTCSQEHSRSSKGLPGSHKGGQAKEAASLPKPPVPALLRIMPDLKKVEGEYIAEQQALLQEQQQLGSTQMNNQIPYHEALIDEHDQGIAESSRQIGEVNEIFQEQAVLVNGQRVMLDDTWSNIDESSVVRIHAWH